MGKLAVVAWDIEPVLLQWPDINPGEWFPTNPPAKPLHQLHWRRRLAMLQAIGESAARTP